MKDQCDTIYAIPNTNYAKIIECDIPEYQTKIEINTNEVIEVIATKLNEHKIINS